MDHTALQHILGQNKLTSRQWRHLDRLQQHDYEVKYYPGMANVVADALSRIAYTQSEPIPAVRLVNLVELQISALEEWLDDVRKGYSQDFMFGPVLELLQGDEVSRDVGTPKDKKTRRIRERAKAYFLQDGLLYHRASGGTLCIPQAQRSEVIREVHDTILGGRHAGIDKTAAAVASRYHWPRLTDSVANWVSGCDVCH